MGKTIEYKVSVDFNKEVGKIKPMHAVGGGPKQGALTTRDISNYYMSMNIPYSRLHDIEHEFGSSLFVDIHNVFPDFDADENDPASYLFEFTDNYIKGIIDAGGKPFYRLGETIDHTGLNRYINPPKDFAKWARICEHIIRHYNEGWADGFHYDIEYWEIWNEPDSYQPGYNKINMWTGTREQYFELYRITSHHLKNCFGDKIKVGGYSCCNLNALIDAEQSPRGQHLLKWADAFFDYINDPETWCPLDFYSYHNYFRDPKLPFRYNNAVRAYVDSKGRQDAEIIFTEWNIEPMKGYAERMDALAAAKLGYIFLTGQKSPTDMMMFYDIVRNSYNGVISEDGCAFAQYHAFVLFGQLYALGTEVDTGAHQEGSDIAYVAAKNDKKAALMIANIHETRGVTLELEIDLKGYENYSTYKIYTMDRVKSPTLPTLYERGKVSDKLVIKYSQREALSYIEFE